MAEFGAGSSASAMGEAARARAARYRIRADRADSAANAWERGAAGEVTLSRTLAPLAADGYFCLSDRALPGRSSNLDHVLVGPGGVYVIDAKNWTGSVQVDGSTLRQNGRSRQPHVESLRNHAAEVAAILEDLFGRERPSVWPVLCLTGEAAIGQPMSLDRVRVCNIGDLVGAVRHHAPQLDQRRIEAVLVGLLDRLPPRLSVAEPIADPPTSAPAPDEPVIFLQPWSKHGLRRLYAKTDQGAEVGFLDLATGQVKANGEQWKPVLARLLPHFVAEAAGSNLEELSPAARGVLRRFLDAVLGRQADNPTASLIVIYHWRKFGKDRLYVHRITPSGLKVELGWVDLLSRSIKPANPDAGELLRYCRTSYEHLRASLG